MPGLPSHMLAASAVAITIAPRAIPARRALLLGAVLGAVPDLDLVSRAFGVAPAACLLGHRGLTHSLPFAIVVGCLVAIVVARKHPATSPGVLAVALILAIGSHALLDMMTATGPGVELFAPFSCARTTLAWHPLDPAGPVAAGTGFLGLVWHHLRYELFGVILPAIAVIVWGLRARVRPA